MSKDRNPHESIYRGKTTIAGAEIHLSQMPIAAADTQFILTDQINAIRSVGYIENTGEVTWKHGKPFDEVAEEVETWMLDVFDIEKAD